MRILSVGQHPALPAINHHLREQGHLLVLNPEDGADICVFGCDIAPTVDFDAALANMLLAKTISKLGLPTLVLSTGSLYSDKDKDMNPAEKQPMSESWPLSLPSSVSPRVHRITAAVLGENIVLDRIVNTMVLRVFNVYGPGVMHSVVNQYIMSVTLSSGGSLKLPAIQPTSISRCYLYVDDLLEVVDFAVKKLSTKGARGIFNVGSTEQVSVEDLLKIAQAMAHPTVRVEEQGYPAKGESWWRVPDIKRIQAFAQWKPKTSIRKGMKMMTDLLISLDSSGSRTDRGT